MSRAQEFFFDSFVPNFLGAHVVVSWTLGSCALAHEPLTHGQAEQARESSFYKLSGEVDEPLGSIATPSVIYGGTPDSSVRK